MSYRIRPDLRGLSRLAPTPIAAVVMIGSACATAAMQVPQDQDAVRRAVIAWLDCEECFDDELSTVASLGDAAVPTLRSVLYGGPSSTALAERERQLNEAYDDLSAYARRRPEAAVGMTREEYVETYLSNYRAGHQIRAALALGEIPTDLSRQALDGFDNSFAARPDVLEAVEIARRSLEGRVGRGRAAPDAPSGAGGRVTGAAGAAHGTRQHGRA